MSDSVSQAHEYSCPSCHQKLTKNEEQSWHCDACDTTFPVIPGGVPILVENPMNYVAGERHLLLHDASQLQATGKYYLETAESTDIRKRTLSEIGQGLLHNSQLLTELSSMLPESQVDIEEHQLALGAELYASLRKDWSGSSETEEELQQAFNALDGLLKECKPEKILVLGAGSGRMLCEISAKYPGTYGIDLSAAMGTAFAKLSVEGELEAYLLHQGNFLRTEDECELIRARRNLSEGSPQYAIANASALPFSTNSFDAILSNYFTDMLPLSLWLPEVKRVLNHEGTFIHFGPVGYAFPQIDEHFAVDQLPAAFAQYGLEISEPQYLRSSFYGSSNRLNRFDFDNLLFTANHFDESRTS